ncbi:hypothetical protein [Pontixanthobacter gangjinensis]|nr:hypothetical protein [Pontixanthobacter gangjinensis]
MASKIHEIASASKSVTVSFDPRAKDVDECGKYIESPWLELLCDSLTFELRNLAVGSDEHFAHSLQSDNAASGKVDDGFERVYLVPGPHLAGGEGSLPILRSMMALAASLPAFLPDIHSFYWPPARSEIEKAQFTLAIDRWLSGGTFPVPELVSLEHRPDNTLKTRGLAFITGQELELEASVSIGPDSAARLAGRLISQLVLQGAVECPDRMIGPDGHPLNLEISASKGAVIVRRG